MAEWGDVRDGGRLLYDPGFRPPGEADALFAWLRSEIPERQEAVRGNPLPRLNAWFADAALWYAYSGLSHLGSGCSDDARPSPPPWTREESALTCVLLVTARVGHAIDPRAG